LKLIPKQLFNSDDSGTLRLLTEREWRAIGITQSLGWEHYEVHGESRHLFPIQDWIHLELSAPEPHVLLFRRPKNFDQVAQAQQNGRPVREGKKR
jgi:cyclin-dependent kinase regulatory subunit CKS1